MRVGVVPDFIFNKEIRMFRIKGLTSLALVLTISGCAVQNFNSYASPDDIEIDRLLVNSLSSSFNEAAIQEVEFCEAVAKAKFTCITAKNFKKPGINFSESDLMKVVKDENVDHVVLVSLVSAKAKNEAVVIQSGNQSQIINGVTEQKLFQVQLISMLNGEIVYSAEIETQYGETTADFQKRNFYGQIFDEVVEDWEKKNIH